MKGTKNKQYEQDTSSKSFSVSPSWTRSSISKSLRSSPLFVPAFCRGLWLPLPARRPAPREVGGWTHRGATRIGKKGLTSWPSNPATAAGDYGARRFSSSSPSTGAAVHSNPLPLLASSTSIVAYTVVALF